jgi:putative glycosyltransferase
MKLSIVATLFHSSAHIEEFCARASGAARTLAGGDYQIVLVNDGSPDNSLDIAVRLACNDAHIAVVDLSRNFGHHRAMMCGLAHASGERVFLIDSDLEEEPECLLQFNAEMEQAECDVVYGVQTQRKGGFVERWTGTLYWKIINRLSGLSLPANILTARLMSRRYVDALLQHKERELFIAGIWHITGFDQRPLTAVKHDKGQSTYNLRRKISLLVNSVVSFSNVPLIGIFYFGALIFIGALVYTGFLLTNWLFFSGTLAGWTSVMASIWLLGGLVISFMGVIGIYVSKIYSETKQRPYAIVRKIYGQTS